MERLGNVVVAASQALQRRSPKAPSVTSDALPAEFAAIDRMSRLVTWRGTDGSIEIARALTDAERAELRKRADDLAPALVPFDRERPGDVDRVAAAAANMYGGFPSMRAEGADATARIDSLMNSLVRNGLPTWAIEQACRSIQDDGYERTDGKKTWTERQWAPSDSEVAVVAQRIVRRRGSALADAEMILSAKVGR